MATGSAEADADTGGDGPVLSARARDALLGALPFLLAVALGVAPLVVVALESVSGGFAAFGEVTTSVYPQVILRSLVVGVVMTAVCLAIAYPVTYWLAHGCPARYRLPLLVALTLPLWLNYVVLNYTWVWILARGGLLNYALTGLGLVGTPLELLYTRVSLFAGFVYIYLPYVLLTMYVSMERLDYRLVEAARDLGAGDWRVFRDVVVPRTVAGAAAGTLIVYARIAGAFATPEILGGPRQQMVAQLIVDAFYELLNYPFASALSLVFLAIVLAGFALGARSGAVREELKRW
jgi:spermidine/putrescine transport system permease protein